MTISAVTPHPGSAHGTEPPSSWIQRWAHLVPPGGSVLDVACGHGRHMQWLSSQGFRMFGVDRASAAVEAASAWGEVVQADIENGPWPWMAGDAPRLFDALVITNYLWRQLWPTLLGSVRPGGVLLYETFAVGHETIGKPSRPDFLLHNGELLQVFAPWRVVAYEDGFLTRPDRFVQRIAAVRPDDSASIGPPTRWPLQAAG